MAGQVAVAPRRGFMSAAAGFVRGIPGFYREVVAEMKKVTWPDRTQVRQLSIGVIGISLFIGLVIWVLDLLLQAVLVRGLPSLFGA